MNADASKRRLNALVIDDDAVLRIAIEDCLDEAGFVVVEAEGGVAGLSAFRARLPDIVLLDVMMPDLDGFEVCTRLRATADGEHVPILMMTGNDDVASISRAFQCGATDFITKPVNPDLLVHRISYMLRAKETADQLRQKENSLAYAQRIARLGNWELDLVQARLDCSSPLLELIGFTCTEPTWTQFLERVVDNDRDRVSAELESCIASGRGGDMEFRMRRPDDSELVVHQDVEVLKSDSGTALRMVGAIQDITAMREAQERIRQLAYYDSVTGLPNRVMLNERLHDAIEAARINDESLSVLFIDLDHFKRINDTWGHAVGDDVLRMVAKRLDSCLRAHDFSAHLDGSAESNDCNAVARIGGDEFVVMLTDLRRPEDAASIAVRINEELSQPFNVRKTELYVTSSVGISNFPGEADDADSLLRQADAAMYEAKSNGRNDYRFYSGAIKGRAFARLSLEAALHRALERDEFVLHYQPKIALKDGSLSGAEALVRWENPSLGTINPAEFIPIAEECGMIVPLGQWVMEQACMQARAWCDAGFSGLRVSVNLSVVQTRDRTLVSKVRQILDACRLPPDMLEFELTESLSMDDTRATMQLLDRLKEIGVRLSIDDFGTGYSSLQYLKKLPVDTLKIDRCFISELGVDEDDAAIVSGTIALAHSLRLSVVAEGVENTTQYEMVRAFGCDESQGFLHSRPLPLEQFNEWVQAQSVRQAVTVAAATSTHTSERRKLLIAESVV